MKRPRQTIPLFCPKCGEAPSRTADPPICALCGDRLIAKGYCPVCERFLDLPIEATCPKHDVPLESEAPPGLAEAVGESPFVWIEVGRFAGAHACQPPRIRLEAEGIPAIIDDERMGDRSMYQVATGGLRLLVPEHLAAEARIILSQTWSATASALDIEEDWPDFDEDEPPASTSISPARTGLYLKNLAYGLLLALLLANLIYLILK